MCLRFLQLFLNNQIENLEAVFNDEYDTPSHTKKVFANMRGQGKDFSKRVTPLFETMLIQHPIEVDEDETVYEEREDRVERVATTASSIEAERQYTILGDRPAQTRFDRLSKQSHEPPLSRVNTLGSGEDIMQLMELMELCTKLSYIVLTLENTKTTQDLEITHLKNKVKRRMHPNRRGMTKMKGFHLFKRMQRFRGVTNAGVSVSTAEPSIPPTTTITLIEDEGLTIAQNIMKIRSVKSKEKSKEKEEPEKLVKVKGKDQIALDEEVAQRLKAQIQAEFEEEERKAESSGKEAVSKKRTEEEFDQEISKRQKTNKSSELAKEPRDKETDELLQEELQQMMIIVPVQGMNVEALQTKYLIINWEIYNKGTKKYWKIIRVGNHTKVHQFFDDMLKAFDRDDLVMLWKNGIDIYILVEKEYPLSRGTLTLMLVAKLLVDQDNEMSRELLRKIFMQAERPRRFTAADMEVTTAGLSYNCWLWFLLLGIYHRKNVDYVYLLWEDLVYQVENKKSKKNNDMCCSRFTKIIIDSFMSKDQSISRKTKMFWHTARDDALFNTVKVISRHQDTQIYSAILPDILTNQEMLNSKAYNKYYAIASGAVPPKAKTRYKKKTDEPVTSPKSKTAFASASKGTRIKSKAKVTKPDVKKQPANKAKAKGLAVLSEVALSEAEKIKLATKRNKKDFHISHASGSRDGVDTQSKVPDEQEQKTSSSNEGIDTIPGVLDVPPYEYAKQVKTMKIQDGVRVSRPGELERHLQLWNDEILDPNLTNVDQTGYEEEEDVNEGVRTPSDDELTDKEKLDDEETKDDEENDEVLKELYEYVNVNMEKDDAEITDANQGDKDKDPSARSDRGTKRRKSGKDAESFKDSRSKEKKSSSTSKDASQSQHKSSSKFVHAEEPSHTVEELGMQQDQKFVTGDNDEQLIDKEVTKADWFKKPERPLTPDPD
nr:hypothetical protein [Tanacetum cinerariifolium]